MIRAFIALPLSQPTLSIMQQAVFILKNRDCYHEVRWSESNNLHLTLTFLGEQELEKIADLNSLLDQKIGKLKPFDIQLSEISFFPNKKKAKVVAALVSPNQLLSECQQVAEAVAWKCGIEVEKQRFRPHITLGRIRKYQRPKFPIKPMILNIVQPVYETDVIQSILTQKGARYSVLKRIKLTGSIETTGELSAKV